MLVSDAHEHLKAFGKKDAAIGISIVLIQRLIELQIDRLNRYFSRVRSNQDFKQLKVEFSALFDTLNTTVRFKNYLNESDENEFFPTLEIENLVINVEGYVDSKKVVQIQTTYNQITGIVMIKNEKLAISLFNEEHEETDFIKIWKDDDVIKDYFEHTYGFDDETWNELTIHFKATSIFSGGPIAEGFIDSLELPNIFKIFVGIIFGDNKKISSNITGELLMVTADTSLNFNTCPVYNSKGSTKVTSFASADGKKYKIGEVPKEASEIFVSSKVDDISESTEYPPGTENNYENTSEAHVFLFTPLELLRFNFEEVRPAINKSESGYFGPIHWRYSVTAALKRMNLSLENIWPIEFKLSLPNDVTGQAGAGIKIGCIRYEAFGAMFDGEIDPFDINFKIHLDWARKQIVFVSKISSVNAKNFRFRTFPRADFPLSEILDLILALATEYVIEDEAESMLNVTRIPIAKLDLLEKVAELMPNTLGGVTDTAGNATMGVKFKR